MVAFLAANLAAAPLATAQTAADGLLVRAVRFYRADQQKTRVTAFVQIPYALVEPTGPGSNGTMSYKVTFKIADSTGLTLHTQSWQNHAPASLRIPGAYALELLDFAIAPGSYRLEVAVRDSVSGHQATSALELKGFAAPPRASDLLLSPEMRTAAADDTVPRPGELRRSNTLITATAVLRVTPLRTKAFYLLEAYSRADTAQEGTMMVSIVDSAGKTLLRTSPTPVAVQPGGSILQGQLDLAGLPPGRYRMNVGVQLGGETIERSGEFIMADLDETLERDVAAREAAQVTDQGYFAAMGAEELDAAFEPLSYIASSSDLRAYDKDELSVAAKRTFLTQFWRKRDPSPGTPRNETREQFYEAIAFANRQYGEPTSSRPGWKTDRGRIFARHGTPDEVLDRPREGRAPPYLVWRYTRDRLRYYVFADRTGLGAYQMIRSNDRGDIGLPNWREILGEDAVRDIGRFVGEDFYAAQAN